MALSIERITALLEQEDMAPTEGAGWLACEIYVLLNDTRGGVQALMDALKILHEQYQGYPHLWDQLLASPHNLLTKISFETRRLLGEKKTQNNRRHSTNGVADAPPKSPSRNREDWWLPPSPVVQRY